MTETRITDDGVAIAHTEGNSEAAVERRPFIVTAESGLYKNGKQFAKGDSIELDEATAENFFKNGDIK